MLFVSVYICFLALNLTLVATMPVDGGDLERFVDKKDRIGGAFISKFNDIVDLKCGKGRRHDADADAEGPDGVTRDMVYYGEHIWRLLEVNKELYQLNQMRRELEELKACYMGVLRHLYAGFRLKHTSDEAKLPFTLGRQFEGNIRSNFKGDADEDFEILDRDEPMDISDDMDESKVDTAYTIDDSDNETNIEFNRISRGNGLRLSDSGYGSRIDAAKNLAGHVMTANNIFGAYGPGKRKRQEEVVDDEYFDGDDTSVDKKRNGDFILDHGYGSRLHAGSTVAKYVVTRNLFGLNGPGRR